MTSSQGSAREGNQSPFAPLDETSAPRKMQEDRESPLWEICCKYVAYLTVKIMGRKKIDHVAQANWCDEIVQEALIAICKGLPRFRGDACLTTWIVPIVEHKVADKLRERRSERKHMVLSLEELDETAPVEPEDTKPPPEVAYLDQEGCAEKCHLLESFCQTQRDPHKTATILNLALQEASTKVTAEQTDISPDTVRRYIRHAQQYLQSATRDYAQTTNVSFEQTYSSNRKRVQR